MTEQAVVAIANEQLTTPQDARNAIQSLQELTKEIHALVDGPTLKNESEYVEQVVPKLDKATAKYQAVASCLQAHKKDPNKEFRVIQRDFVKTMQAFQLAQRTATERREAICDAEFLGATGMTEQDLQAAKEEVLEAGEIAQEAVILRDLFQQVGSMVHEQSAGIEAIEDKVDAVCIEIGNGVSELEQAARLQAEARQKYMLIALVVVLILCAVLIPILTVFL